MKKSLNTIVGHVFELSHSSDDQIQQKEEIETGKYDKENAKHLLK